MPAAAAEADEGERESDQRGAAGQAERGEKRPRQPASDAGNGQRAEQAEHRADDAGHEEDDKQEGQCIAGISAARGGVHRGGGQRFAANDLVERRHSGPQAAGKIALAETRRHLFGHNALGDGVGNGAFEPVADFDAHASVVLGDDDDHPVIDALAADFPGFGEADAKLLDAFRLGCWQQHDGNLRALVFFQ